MGKLIHGLKHSRLYNTWCRMKMKCYNKNDSHNCRWVDQKAQVRNRRNTIQITYKGETKPLAEWCELLNLNYGTIKRRYYKGWDVPKLFEFTK